MKLQGPVQAARLKKLRELNRQMARVAARPRRAFQLDHRWHRTLVQDCPNALLLEHLRSVRLRAERYERAYMRYSGRIPTSTKDHERIVEALARNPESVPPLLLEHWKLSLDFVRRWLSEAATEEPS